MQTSDPLSQTFAALADPTRRAILARLASGACSVSELAQPFEMSMPAVSKHLRVLERAGLIGRGKEAQWRPCRLQPQPIQEVAAWAEGFREMWEQRLDRLETYLQSLQATRARAAVEPSSSKPSTRGRRRSGRNTRESAHGRKSRR